MFHFLSDFQYSYLHIKGDLLTMDEPDTFSSPMQPVTQSVAQTGGLVTIPEEDADLVHDLFIGSLTAATNERSIIYENASVKISVAYEFRAYAVSLYFILLTLFHFKRRSFLNLTIQSFSFSIFIGTSSPCGFQQN